MILFQTVDLSSSQQDVVRRRRYGMIEVVDERLVAIHLRPWPKMVSLAEVCWQGGRFHRSARGNRCLLYYNQPWRHERFLALKYAISSSQTTFKTIRCALLVLDEIARLKSTDAIVAEVSNRRITDRMMERFGWEPQLLGHRRRHFIKRFYGQYPERKKVSGTFYLDKSRSVR